MNQRWYDRKEGEWFALRREGYRIGCCDCGLVHRLRIRIRGNRIEMAAWRDLPETKRRRCTKRHAFRKHKLRAAPPVKDTP